MLRCPDYRCSDSRQPALTQRGHSGHGRPTELDLAPQRSADSRLRFCSPLERLLTDSRGESIARSTSARRSSSSSPGSPTATTSTVGPRRRAAREFGLSRPKVQRLLERARWAGVVDIHIEVPPWLHLDLEDDLRERFGLAEVDRDARAARIRGHSARRWPAAPRATSIGASATATSSPSATAATPARCRASSGPGVGSPARSSARWAARRDVDEPTNPNEICRALAERSGGRAVSLYAPAHVESAEMRDRLLEQQAVADTLGIAAAGGRGPRRHRRHRRRLHDGPQRLLLARGDRAPPQPRRRRRHPRQLRRLARANRRVARQLAAHRPLDGRPPPHRDRRGGRQRSRRSRPRSSGSSARASSTC